MNYVGVTVGERRNTGDDYNEIKRGLHMYVHIGSAGKTLSPVYFITTVN